MSARTLYRRKLKLMPRGLRLPRSRLARARRCVRALHRDALKWLSARLGPSPSETRAMVEELLQACEGNRDTLCSLLYCELDTLYRWLNPKVWDLPYGTSARAVWLLWCLLLHPEKLRTAYDIPTWGRYSTGRIPRRRSGKLLPPSDGSDWVI